MIAQIAVSKEKYLHEAQFALFGCQMVEETLKSILMYAREINEIIPAEYPLVHKTDEQLEELPLGTLIDQYKKAFPESAVVTSLKALRPERNHCAHRALVFCFLSDLRDNISLQVEFDRIESTRKLAWSCFHILLKEAQNLLNRLNNLRAQSIN